VRVVDVAVDNAEHETKRGKDEDGYDTARQLHGDGRRRLRR